MSMARVTCPSTSFDRRASPCSVARHSDEDPGPEPHEAAQLVIPIPFLVCHVRRLPRECERVPACGVNVQTRVEAMELAEAVLSQGTQARRVVSPRAYVERV